MDVLTPERGTDGMTRRGRVKPKVGVAFTPFETRADVIIRLAVLADELRLDRVDVAEGWTHDAMLLLAEVAARTTHIGIGTSIISVWGRTPATMALGAAGLQRISGGRFTLGIGAGSPPLAEGFHGMPWAEPLAHLRYTLTNVVALVAGARLPHPVGETRPLRLGVVPDVPVPIALAALAPGSVRLAGELADVWSPFLWARSRLSEGRALLDEGEARAVRPKPTRIAVGVPVALGANAATADALAAWWLTTYTTRMGPLYPRMLAERFGMADAVDAVVAGARAGDDLELPAEARVLAADVTLQGTHDEAAERMRSWLAAGADSLQLVLPPGRPEEELAAILRVAAAAVAAPR